MTKVTIDRELLELSLNSDEQQQAKARNKLREQLAAPRQPEGEAKPDRNRAFDACPDSGCDWGSFWQGWKACHADAHRAIAELREECEGAESQAEYQRDRAEHFEAERDTLRQQLAERDAKLLAIASAEPSRHTIEWAKAMAATGNNEAYVKWREAFDQRDRLAGLLADVKADYTHAIHWEDMHATMKRIDAALAEVEKAR